MTRDYRDIVGGAFLVLGGFAYGLYTLTHYRLGSVQAAGPGFFPLCLSVALVGLGSLVAIPALGREGVFPKFELFAPAMVFLALAVFALMIRSFGLIPSVVALTIVAALAERRIRPSLIWLCLLLSVLSYLIFGVGLRVSVSMFRWPF